MFAADGAVSSDIGVSSPCTLGFLCTLLLSVLKMNDNHEQKSFSLLQFPFSSFLAWSLPGCVWSLTKSSHHHQSLLHKDREGDNDREGDRRKRDLQSRSK